MSACAGRMRGNVLTALDVRMESGKFVARLQARCHVNCEHV